MLFVPLRKMSKNSQPRICLFVLLQPPPLGHLHKIPLLFFGMTCIEQTLSRRNIRTFKDEPVNKDILSNNLEAGSVAPSATNIQP